MDLQYELEVPETIKMVADNALALSYDSFSDEVLVFGQILDLRCLTARSAKLYRYSIGQDREEFRSPVIEVEYEAWILPAGFAPKDPEILIYHRDRAFVDADTLLKDEIVTYGLGPEYNHLEWQQIEVRSGSFAQVNFPPTRLELLADVIASHRNEQIVEYLKEGGEVPDHLSAPVFKLYKELSEAARSQIAREEQEFASWEAAEVARQNEDRLPFAELKFDVGAAKRPTQIDTTPLIDTNRRLILVLPSAHKSRLLYIFATRLNDFENGWSIEASIVRKSSFGTIFYAEQAKETFRIPCASSVEAVEKEIMAQIEDGSLTHRFVRTA